jgi:hypothetical protein
MYVFEGAYIPLFFCLFQLVNFVASRPTLSKYIGGCSSKICAQYAQGIVHVHGMLILRLLIAYLQTFKDTIFLHGRAFSISYFAFDTLFIVSHDWSQWMYIPHHIVAILIGYFTPFFSHDVERLMDYIFYIEMSNICLTLWDLSKRNRKTMLTIYEVLTPFFALSYVPLRLVHLTVATYRLFVSFHSYQWILGSCLAFILAMSYYFSKKLIATLYYKTIKYEYKSITHPTFTDRLYKLLKNPDDRWWPIITYIVKWYLTIHYLVHVIPHANNVLQLVIMSVVDFGNMLISFSYYLYEYQPLTEKLNFLSINYKIIINTLMYFWVHRNHGSYLVWDIAVIASIGVVLLSTIHTFVSKGTQLMLTARSKTFVLYAIPFILCIAPVFVHNIFHEHSVKPYISMAIYGGAIWALNMPEAFIKTRYLNSLGWMHACIIIGDVVLMHDIASISQ